MLDYIIDTEADTEYDDELWEAACKEADRRGDDVFPEDVLREWDYVDTFDGYNEDPSNDLYDRIAFDCD